MAEPAWRSTQILTRCLITRPGATVADRTGRGVWPEISAYRVETRHGGEGVLFKKFADIDVFDIELDAAEPDRFIDVVCAMAPTFGGINLEDIKAPECFYIEEQLRERLDIPVFHDDQHGTAIISGAALLNAAKLQGKALDEMTMVVSGAGASAIACAQFYIRLGVNPEHVLMVTQGRHPYGADGSQRVKRAFARDTKRRTSRRPSRRTCFGSRGGLVDEEMVRSMAENPIIFALANPIPRSTMRREAGPSTRSSPRRSDYNNQVNNVLGFRYRRGDLDASHQRGDEGGQARRRGAAQRDVPSRNRVYADYTFGPTTSSPSPSTCGPVGGTAVAEAAVETGVARIDRPKDYRERMRTLLGGATALMRRFVRRAQRDPRRIVFIEGEHPQILEACAILADEGSPSPCCSAART